MTAQPVAGGPPDHPDHEGEEHRQGLEEPDLLVLFVGHGRHRAAQRRPVASAPRPSGCRGAVGRVRIGGDPHPGLRPGGPGESSVHAHDPTAQFIFGGMRVGHAHEGARDLDVGRRRRAPAVVGRVLDGAAQAGLHRQPDGGGARDAFRLLPPGGRAVGRIGGRLGREHDVVPPGPPELGRQRPGRPGHEHAGAFAPGRGCDAQAMEVELGLRGQRILVRVADRDDDQESHGSQSVPVDDAGVARGADPPVAHRDERGVGRAAGGVGTGVGGGLDPVERGDQTCAGQVRQGRQQGSLADGGDEDAHGAALLHVARRGGESRVSTQSRPPRWGRPRSAGSPESGWSAPSRARRASHGPCPPTAASWPPGSAWCSS